MSFSSVIKTALSDMQLAYIGQG